MAWCAHSVCDDSAPSHCYPIAQMPDMEHPAGALLSQAHPMPDCWCCQQGICWQRVEEHPYGDGNYWTQVTHGVPLKA